MINLKDPTFIAAPRMVRYRGDPHVDAFCSCCGAVVGGFDTFREAHVHSFEESTLCVAADGRRHS